MLLGNSGEKKSELLEQGAIFTPSAYMSNYVWRNEAVDMH